MTARPLVSLVVPTYQRRGAVLRLLESLRTQTLPPDRFEAIVAVDGSTDGTAEAVRSLAAPFAVRVLEGPNRGRAGACNAGIRAAAGAIVVLLDDDMEATPDLLAAHARAHEGAGWRAVVGAAPIIDGPDASPFVRYMADGFRARMERIGRPGHRLSFREAYTGNFSAPRDALLAVGGFDEAFRVYGHEDYELALRLQAAGVELAFSAEACAHQHYDKTFAGFARDGIARGRTAVLFAGKHPEVRGRLKLAEYRDAPWKWRALRGLLLGLGRVTDRGPAWVVACMARLEALQPARLNKYYTLAIDYLFWYGALGAMRERDGAGAIARGPRAAIALVLLYAGVSTVQWTQRVAQWPSEAGRDEISANDRRFARLRSGLPAGGVVGYLGDPEPAGPTAREANAAALLHFRRQLLAQYALAPVVLMPGTGPDLVVGNFHGSTVPSVPPGFLLADDFGDGVILFRRAAP